MTRWKRCCTWNLPCRVIFIPSFQLPPATEPWELGMERHFTNRKTELWKLKRSSIRRHSRMWSQSDVRNPKAERSLRSGIRKTALLLVMNGRAWLLLSWVLVVAPSLFAGVLDDLARPQEGRSMR